MQLANEDVIFEIEYDLQSAYGVSEINTSSIVQIVQLIADHAQYYMNYLSHEYVFYPWKRGTALCAIVHQKEEEFTECINEFLDDN